MRLRQILLNLTGNAVKFTAQGAVSVRVLREPDGGGGVALRFEVRDTGPGIARERLAALFQPFAQAEASTARKFGGSGLGLAISRQIAELMGGKIGVESTEGKGSLFWFTAVFKEHMGAKGAADGEGDEILPLAGADGSGARILVVEDDETTRKVALLQLKQLGFQSRAASGGEEALRMLAEETFDVVLMDCQMAGMDGYETTRRVRAGDAGVRNPAVPIIAMTANAAKDAARECRAAGMNDYISKPFRASSLAAIVANWLPKRSPDGDAQKGD